MTLKHIALTAATFLSTGALFAQGTPNTTSDDDLQLNTITSAVPFMQIITDSRSGAMGDAGTALSPSYASIFWNTSMLSFSEKDAEIGLSYSPWLSAITDDIDIVELTGYKNLNARSTVGLSLRYFSLGEITFTDNEAEVTRIHEPTEYAITGAYAFKLNEQFSLGLNGKFIFSNLTAGQNVAGSDTKAGIAGAADLSFSYNNPSVKYGSTNGGFAFGLTVNNLGNKVAYSSASSRDFLPTNLKIGSAFTFDFDKFNSLTWNTDISKLLIPTTPNIQENSNGDLVIASGLNPEVGVIAGIMQSFYDAPGRLATDEDGDYIENEDGSFETVKGSRLKEELNEIMIGSGLEYWYNDIFAVRGGFFYEHRSKGSRQHATFGVGIKYNKLNLDFSYLISMRQGNPLANTLRFSLALALGNDLDSKGGITD